MRNPMSRTLLTTKEAAKYLNVSESFLAKDRMRGGDIPYVKIGVKTIRYDKDELDKYLDSRKLL